MKKTPQINYFIKSFFLFLLLNVSLLQAQGSYSSLATLLVAVKTATTAGTGGTFILKDGTYNNVKVYLKDAHATAANPIIIKAENASGANVGGVVFTGDFAIGFTNCEYITMQGFKINATASESSSLVKYSVCRYMRFTRNDVTQLMTVANVSSKWIYIGGNDDEPSYPFAADRVSHHNTIDYNNFHDKASPGCFITLDGTAVDGQPTAYYQTQYDVIDHNYFGKLGPRAVNEKEAIRVGESAMSMSSGFTTISYNLFEECDGDPEVVSIKSCDNYLMHNTFKNNYGTLSFRHGNRNRAEGNYFFGGRASSVSNVTGATLYTGGMRIYGADHVIVNNYFEGLNGTKWDAPMTLTQGNQTNYVVSPSESTLQKHFLPENITIAYNTFVDNDQAFELGYSNSTSKDPYNLQMKNIKIANNLVTMTKNTPVKILDSKDPGAQITWSNNLMYTNGGTVITGGTTSSFTTAQSNNVNPNLIYDGVLGAWRSSASTPTYTNIATITNSEDIDGQTRPTPSSNVGADQYDVLESVRYAPMTTATVGPSAVSSALSVAKNEVAGLKIYPNPVNNGVVYINTDSSEVKKVVVYDVLGKQLLEKNIANSALDVSALNKGVYLLKVAEGAATSTKKIIIE